MPAAPRSSLLLAAGVSLVLLGSSSTSAAASLVSYDIGALDGSVLVGAGMLAAADKLSLLRAAGLNNQQGLEQSTAESPYTDFGGVGSASDGLVRDYNEAGTSSSNVSMYACMRTRCFFREVPAETRYIPTLF